MQIYRPVVDLTVDVEELKIAYAQQTARHSVAFALEAPTEADDEEDDGEYASDFEPDSDDESGQTGRVQHDSLVLRWMATSDITSAHHDVDINDLPRMDVHASLQCSGSGGETLVSTKAAEMAVPLDALTSAQDEGVHTFVVAVECRRTGASAVTSAFGWRPTATQVRVASPAVLLPRWYSVDFDLTRAEQAQLWSDASTGTFSGVVFVWATHETLELDPRYVCVWMCTSVCRCVGVCVCRCV